MKKGGSLSTKWVLSSRTALLDFSNHRSALLVSPELFLPPTACRLDGESVPVEAVLTAGRWTRSLSLDAALSLESGDFRACSNETERFAGGRRGCMRVCESTCGDVLTIVGRAAVFEVILGPVLEYEL